MEYIIKNIRSIMYIVLKHIYCKLRAFALTNSVSFQPIPYNILVGFLSYN